jgi:hypothetical protein
VTGVALEETVTPKEGHARPRFRMGIGVRTARGDHSRRRHVLSVRTERVAHPALRAGNPRAAALLTAAVNADLSSGSFVAHVVGTIHRRGCSGTTRYTLVYEAPDRSEVITPGSTNAGTLITIGDTTYANTVISSAGSTGWVGCKILLGRPTGASLATADLIALRHRTGVSVIGGRFRIAKVVRTETSGSGEDIGIFTATVAGNHVIEEDLQADAPSETSHLTISYGQFGSAPGIPVPPHVSRCLTLGTTTVLPKG